MATIDINKLQDALIKSGGAYMSPTIWEDALKLLNVNEVFLLEDVMTVKIKLLSKKDNS
jgi:hypothetical protein